MYHGNRHDIIETDDIQDIQHVHIAEENGQKIAYIKAVLDPRKDYSENKQVHVHLTNGVNHRTLGPFEHAQPLPDGETVQAEGADS